MGKECFHDLSPFFTSRNYKSENISYGDKCCLHSGVSRTPCTFLRHPGTYMMFPVKNYRRLFNIS